MQLGGAAWTALRNAVFDGLAEGSKHRPAFERCLVPQSLAEYSLPATIGDFTDFYTSIHHATAVGRLFRPDNPLLPNYKWLPIGYHGRSSSIGVSGQEIHRPWGQRLPAGQSEPVVEPSARLDYELELGVFLGPGNPLGTPITIENAEAHVFGLCLLNDWSARDIQAWEYQPLGPFLAKNFATTISPWIVSLQALAPFRVPHARGPGDPPVPAYLASSANDAAGGFDIRLEVDLRDRLDARSGRPAAAPLLHEFSPLLLDRGAAHRSSHAQRLQPAGRRSARHRHPVRSDSRGSGLDAGIERRGQAAHRARIGGEARISRRRRCGDAARLV